jgi:hypothetical protein
LRGTEAGVRGGERSVAGLVLLLGELVESRERVRRWQRVKMCGGGGRRVKICEVE